MYERNEMREAAKKKKTGKTKRLFKYFTRITGVIIMDSLVYYVKVFETLKLVNVPENIISAECNYMLSSFERLNNKMFNITSKCVAV